MKEMYCQVLFNNPSKELVEMGCNDRSVMVYSTADGEPSETVWNTVLYSLLQQQTANPDADAMQKELHRAYVSNDGAMQARIKEKYLLETSLTLRNHVIRTLREFDQLIEHVDNTIEAAGGLAELEKEHKHIGMIHRHNQFVRGVFQKAKERLEEKIQAETRRRQRVPSQAR